MTVDVIPGLDAVSSMKQFRSVLVQLSGNHCTYIAPSVICPTIMSKISSLSNRFISSVSIIAYINPDVFYKGVRD